MRNQAPRPCNRWIGGRRGLILSLLAVWLVASAVPGLAADRRFAVILAYPNKTFQALGEEADFANPAMVDAQYFDTNPNNDIYSLAEWWEEISYGAVTVSGDTFGWINLPWPLEPVDWDDDDEVDDPRDYINLNWSSFYEYGEGEPFAEDPMPTFEQCFDGLCNGIPIDYNGNTALAAFLGQPADAYPPPTACEECCRIVDGALTGECTEFKDPAAAGICPDDSIPVFPGPLPHPICAEGQCCSTHGCEAIDDVTTNGLSSWECVAKYGYVVHYDLGETPKACYRPCIDCPDHRYFLPFPDRPNIPSLPLMDGIYTPGERFRDLGDPPDGRYTALFEPVMPDTQAQCDPPGPPSYADIDGDGLRDLPEPFEDHMRRWDPFYMAGAGEWVKVTGSYIRSNYPLNPAWSLRDELWRFGLDCTETDPMYSEYTPFDEAPIRNCQYFRCEMLIRRGLASIQGGLCYEDDDCSDGTCIDLWTNVDELAWRTGNGVYDPPERFRDARNADGDPVSTKMQHAAAGGDPWTVTVPPPGTYGPFDGVAWYDTFWRARYGTAPPPWAKGNPGRNSPRLAAFDPLEPHPGYDNPAAPSERRRFIADGGRPDYGYGEEEQPLVGNIEPDATVGFYDGWVEHDDLASSRYHAFGDQRLGEATSPASFDIAGEDISPHDPTVPPLPDNKTVAAGPLALHVHGNTGLDAGNLLVLEWMTWRTDINWNLSAQAGGWSIGVAWDWESANPGRTKHPYAGPARNNSFSGVWVPGTMGAEFRFGLGPDVDGNGVGDGLGDDVVPDSSGYPDGWGFRDYNLDGLIDQGEVRPAGSENYKVDSVFGTPDNGTGSVYPFNRRRLLEDCIEVLDYSTDFDLFRDTNSLARVAQVRGWANDGVIANVREGLVSGIVLFPPNAISDHNAVFPRAPSFYPIHTADRPPNLDSIGVINEHNPGSHLPAVDPRPLPGKTQPFYYNQDLWFHDLPAGVDRGTVAGGGAGGAGGDGGARYQIRYAAHEYGHSWEGYPDLYDYRRIQPDSGKERYPVGTWCVMADGIRGSGYPGHPVADLKSEYSEWIEPVNLQTQLTPGVEREITFANAETSKSGTYYYFGNPLVEPDPTVSRPRRARERFYFWRAGFGGAGLFDPFFPGQGLLILHTDWTANDEAIPPQQGDPFTWNIIQADGLYDLDGGVNVGDAGDPFPGSAGTTVWNYETFPKAHSRWEGGAFSGIEITDIIEAGGGTRVTFEWTPTAVPSLTFVNPPSGSTVDGVYSIAYWAYDLYAGTTLEFYYIRDDKAFDENDLPTYDGFPIAPPPNHSRGKETPRILESGTMPWDLTLNTDQQDDPAPGVADGRYFIYCRLVPGVGEEGNTEPAVSKVLAGRANQGNGNLASPTDPNARPVVDPTTSKLEHWTVEYIGGPDSRWSVEGSICGVQQQASTGKLYSSDKNEVQFKIRPGDPDKPFMAGDQFTFVTTGKTAYSDGLTVKDQTVVDNPIARIIAVPVAGKPPLDVSFDARSSDPNGAPSLEFSWTFGDGTSPARGAEVEHTYEQPGTFSATLIATNPQTGAFGTAEVEIRVENQGPTAVIEYTILTPEDSFPYDVRFSGSESEDPEDLPLEFLWTFDDRRNGTSTEMDPPVHTYYEDPDSPAAWYCAEVALEVTDSAGDAAIARLDDPPLTPGLATPTVAFTMTDSTVEVGQEVGFSAENLTIEPNDDPNVSYSWNFDDSQTATGLTATHTYDQADTYEVTFTLKYDSNCEPAFSATRQVRVMETISSPDAPTAKFTYTVDPESWITYTFDASESNDAQDDTGDLTYEWNFNDGSDQESKLGDPVIVHQFSGMDTFQVQLTVLDSDGNAGVFSQNVTVAPPGEAGGDSDNKPPVASFTAEPASGPAPLTVDFTSTSSDPDNDTLSHEWDFGDDSETATATADPTHTFVEPGSYTVTLTVTDPEGLSDSASQVVEVNRRANRPPVARIATVRTEVNAAGELILDATLSTDPDGDPLTYIWQVFQNQELIEFGSPLTGPILLVQFRNALAACTDVADPCLAPGVYDFVVTVDDGFGGKSVSSAVRVTFKPTEAGAGVGDGEPGAGTPDAVPITGRARSGGGGGLCGLGILMPAMLAALAMAATMGARRRRW